MVDARRLAVFVLALMLSPGCSASNDGGGGAANSGETSTEPETQADTLGEVHSGQYHLGPVDFAQSEWTNACGPYPDRLLETTGLGGEYLAGLSGEYAEGGGACDACLLVTTGAGRSIVLRAVTYGATNEPGDIDVSPSAYEALNTDEYPRTMTWQFAKCPEAATLAYQFQTGASPWWTSLWVRTPSVPIQKVEVRSAHHAEFYELRRETDGTLNDDGGFGTGGFTLRTTAIDGQVITETFDSFEAGELIISERQFK